MEDQGSSVGMTKKPPPVYPKFCALKTASELPPESLLSSVVTPPASFREFPQSSLSDLSRDDVASGCEMQLGDPDNSYNIKINHQEEMKYSKCDKEALEVIEQLDKSIDEVILSDHEYAKVIQVETLQQVSDDKNSEECFLKNDHMPTTVTENTTVKTKTVLTNTEVSLTFNLPNNHIQNGVLDPAMADAAVNTDFDVEDNGDLKLEIMNKDIQCILNGTATNLDNSSNIQKIGPVNNLSSHSCSDGNFRVELTSTPISSVSIKKPGEAIKTPKMATVPKSAFLGRLNQEHSIIKKGTI